MRAQQAQLLPTHSRGLHLRPPLASTSLIAFPLPLSIVSLLNFYQTQPLPVERISSVVRRDHTQQLNHGYLLD